MRATRPAQGLAGWSQDTSRTHTVGTCGFRAVHALSIHAILRLAKQFSLEAFTREIAEELGACAPMRRREKQSCSTERLDVNCGRARARAAAEEHSGGAMFVVRVKILAAWRGRYACLAARTTCSDTLRTRFSWRRRALQR